MKKRTKKLLPGCRGVAVNAQQISKSFLLLFFKKEVLFFFSFCLPPAHATELCRFSGTTDYAGHVTVTTKAATAGGVTRVDVAVAFEATTAIWFHIRYLVEEISQWRDGALQRLDTNTRTIMDGRVTRQQWDDFEPHAGGLQAYRVQGKTLAQFARQFPPFARHWDLASFGTQWLSDYAAAPPQRRPDLDLTAVPPNATVRSPFAMAFYWVRFLPPGARPVSVFLPGFKADKLADVALAPAPGSGGRVWRAVLHHAYLRAAPASTAVARISPDGYLQVLAFEFHSTAGSARGVVHAAGCSGTAQKPDDR